MKNIIGRLKYVKLNDIFDVLKLIIFFPLSLIFKIYLKIKHREIWVICEAPLEACDNGYHLFKYIREYHKEIEVYYAIKKESNDYLKIKQYGNIIEFGSLKHWIYYLCATKNISTHKYGNPSKAVFYILQVFGILRNKRVFLQHGITQNNVDFIHYKNSKFRLFICGAKREFEFVKEKFGYPDEYVVYTGLPRFDALISKEDSKQILLMPTWRNWLGKETNILGNDEEFLNSEYYKYYSKILNDSKLLSYLEQKKVTLYFYPHRNMSKYIKEFKSPSKFVKIVTQKDIDIQELMISSSLMITDYSSVAFDFVYMEKPIIYYQFDYERFRKDHLKEGYFSYQKDGFGEVIKDHNKLVDKIISYIENDYKIEKSYKNRINSFFEIHDHDNCKRVFEEIKKI